MRAVPFLIWLVSAIPAAPALSVLSAGAVEDAMVRLAQRFERDAGHAVVAQFATGPEIEKRLSSGAAPDVLIAPAAVVERAVKAGRAVAGSEAVIARVGVGVAVRRGVSAPRIATPEDEISDPSKPRYVWHIPNDSNRNSRSTSVVYDYKFDGSGRDYLIRNSEALTQGETGNDLKYQIFDITSRDSDPSKISLFSEITGTEPNSCGQGCGGTFIMRTHKGWWSQDTGYFYAESGEPGFRNIIVQIFDLKNPREPRLVGRAWIPGLKDGEPGYEGQYSHHPIVDEENKRLYVGYRNAGGQAASFDISDPAHPKLVWEIDMNPPHRGPHTVSPIVYNQVPNFGKAALPRTYAFIVDEAGGAADMKPCQNPVRAGAYMLDITTENKPFPVSVWQVPVGNFCEKGGRFGPHQSADTVNGKINRFEDKIAWIAYFNAGIRVVDLSDPYHLKELGHYIPKTNKNSFPIEEGQPVVVQINDVDIDHRGLAYASDRVGTGLFILEYTGRKPQQPTSY